MLSRSLKIGKVFKHPIACIYIDIPPHHLSKVYVGFDKKGKLWKSLSLDDVKEKVNK
jgi:uncharacterized membrane protein